MTIKQQRTNTVSPVFAHINSQWSDIQAHTVKCEFDFGMTASNRSR